MNKFILICLSLFAFSFSSYAQIFDPVEWTTATEKISDTEFDLITTATIEDGWHLYSQNVPDGGPIPTTFTYENNGSIEFLGGTSEEEGETVDDPIFDMRITYFGDKTEFKQRIKILNEELSLVKGEVEFMVCDDERCLPPNSIELTFVLNEIENGASEQGSTNIFGFNEDIENPVTWQVEIENISDTEYQIYFKAEIENGWHLSSQVEPDGIGPLPTEFTFVNKNGYFELLGETLEPNVEPVYNEIFDLEVKQFDDEAVFTQKIKINSEDLMFIEAEVEYQVCNDEKCINGDEQFQISLTGGAIIGIEGSLDEHSLNQSKKLDLNVTGWDKFENQDVEKKSSFTIFFLGFLGGLIALLTPCVFPMIPLTVSFFTKSAANSSKGVRDSVMYGFFIFLIYFLLSLPFHLIDSLDPEILNNISTNTTLNLIFFAIFVVFAFSFFGYFELTLPASWSSALDSKANKIGGFVGIFLMALTLAIVSFSCTGPILGALLGSTLSTDAGATQLTLGMSGFGLALALPFTLFAMFPKWLNSLPKSGGWLNTVKVVLGFIELGLALKFLSNADLVEHWGILKREIFIGLWIIIAIGLALYLFGKIKFPHDSPVQKLGKSRIAFGVVVIAFVIYLIPGLTNTAAANLKLLSGFPPPLFYSVYDKATECPLALNCYKDLDEGLAAAKAENKPILLDFTGWTCVNCRKMEEQVWSEDDVYDILLNNYVIISLYVDDDKELEESQKFDYLKPSGSIKKIKTIGNKWATLQTLNFKNNSQPFYAVLNHDFELLNHTEAYNPDDEDYLNWLQTGLRNFNKDELVQYDSE